MKIALAQLNYTVGDIDGNTSKIVDTVRRAKDHADVVIFAEQAVSGTPSYDLLRRTGFLERCEDALTRIARVADGIDVVVGVPYLTTDGVVSAAAVIQGGKVQQYVTKRAVRVRRELGFLSAGEGLETIRLGPSKEQCILVLGDDLYETQEFDNGVDTIVNIASRRYYKGALSSRNRRISQLAYVHEKRVVTVNQVGASTEVVFDGMSGVVDARGEVVMLLKSFEEDFQVFDTNENHKKIEPLPLTATDRTRFLFEASVCGLRDFFTKNGYAKAGFGLSGGIDSAVVAALAVAALGKENVRGLMMPSPFSSEGSVDDAVRLAENLGIEFDVVPISEAYKAVVDTLIPVIGGTQFDATEENIQARLRTVMLMALQNKADYILLNCSNKSENALGLCTLYGDTAGAISVTGDLYKTEMYDLARYINRTMGDVIPESILTKAPSSELRPDQKDSDTLPPYEVVDAILYRMIEEGQQREEIINAGFDSDEVLRIHSMVLHNEKKRYQYPPVLRLSSSSLGHEYRMPLTHKYGN